MAEWSEYGEVDGPRPEITTEILRTDPFESLLGMCRMCGLHYKVRQWHYATDTSREWWSATLTSVGHWPGDFYGGAGTQTGKRSWSCVAATNRLDALSTAFRMCFDDLRQNCTAWRQAVVDHTDLRSWFVESANRSEEKEHVHA